MQLLDAGEEVNAGALLGVVRAALVRVLAVAQVGGLCERQHQRLRESLYVAEPARDRRLVRRGGRERLRRQRAPRRERQGAAFAQIGEDAPVLVGA